MRVSFFFGFIGCSLHESQMLGIRHQELEIKVGSSERYLPKKSRTKKVSNQDKLPEQSDAVPGETELRETTRGNSLELSPQLDVWPANLLDFKLVRTLLYLTLASFCSITRRHIIIVLEHDFVKKPVSQTKIFDWKVVWEI